MAKRIESVDILFKNKDVKVLAGIKKELKELKGLAQDIKIDVDVTGTEELTDNIKEMIHQLDLATDLLAGMQTDTRATAEGINKLNQSLDDMGSILYESAARTQEVSEKMSDLNKNTRTLDKTNRKTNDTLKRMDTHAMNIGRSFGKLAKSGNKLSLAINVPFASALATVYSLQTALSVLTSGEQLNKLEKLNSIITADSGQALSVTADALKETSKNMLSSGEAMKVAAKGAAYGFSKEDMVNFTKYSKAASAQLGRDFSETMNRAMEGVAKLEKEQLDELGLTFTQLEAQKAYGNKYNISGELNAGQKADAFKEMFFEKMEEKYGKLVGKVTDPAPWEQFGKAVATNFDLITSKLAEATGGFASFLTHVLNYTDKFNKKVKDEQAANATLSTNLKDKNLQGVVNSLLSIKNSESPLDKEIAAKRKVIEELEQQYNIAALKKEQALREKFKGTAESYTMQPMPKQAGAAKQAMDLYEARKKELEQLLKLNKEREKQVVEADKFIKEKTGTTGVYSVENISNTFTNFDKAKTSASDLGDYVKQIKGEATLNETLAGTLKTVNDALKDKISILASEEDKLAAVKQMGFESIEQWKAQSAALNTYVEATRELNRFQERQALIQLTTFRKGRDSIDGEIKVLKAKSAFLNKQYASLKAAGATEDVLAAKKAEIHSVQLQKEQALYSKMEQRYSLEQQMLQLSGLKSTANNSVDKVGSARLAYTTAESHKMDVYDNKASTEEQKLLASIDVEQKKIALQNTILANIDKEFSIKENIMQLDIRKGNLTEAERLEQERLLLSKKLEATLDVEGYDAAQKRLEITNQIANKEQSIAEAKERQSTAMSNIMLGQFGLQSNQGMNSDQLAQAQAQQGLQVFDSAFSQLGNGNSVLQEMGTNILNLSEAMVSFGETTLTSGQMVAMGLQTANSMMQYSAQQQTSAIDQQINAEKKRDGKSKESIAKIKQLEAKKKKIRDKAARESIITNTASSIMMAMGTLPYPMNLVAAGVAAAMGALSLSQVGKSSGGADINPEESKMSLSIGKRSNAIDVSKGATGGELSYLRGERGTGSIQNFQSPRANGGSGQALQSLVVGEHGREVITPEVPVRVTPADSVGGSVTNNYYNVTNNNELLDITDAEERLGNITARGMKSAVNMQHPDLYGIL